MRLSGREQQLELTPGETILEAALQARPDTPYACVQGACGTCKAKLGAGTVEMDQNFALGTADLSDGYVLTCQMAPNQPGRNRRLRRLKRKQRHDLRQANPAMRIDASGDLATVAQARDAAVAAERLGHDGWFTPETQTDPVVGAAIASAATNHVKIGPAVAVAKRHGAQNGSGLDSWLALPGFLAIPARSQARDVDQTSLAIQASRRLACTTADLRSIAARPPFTLRQASAHHWGKPAERGKAQVAGDRFRL